MNKDTHKGITGIRYNSLNLPVSIEIDNGRIKGRTKYLYSASGAKLQVTHETDMNPQTATVMGSAPFSTETTDTKVTDYVGNKIYEDGVLKKILVDGGYIDMETGEYHFYITDHLGNNRVVAKSDGTVVQKNHYYPFGMEFAENSGDSDQPYKYNGKELDKMHGLNMYDYSARYMEPAIGRFTTVDPLAEIYYHLSPYAYCGNNPIKFIDPTGMAHTSSDPNQWYDLMNHLANGGSVDSYNTAGWKETEDPKPQQDGWPPYGDVNWQGVAATQKGLDGYAYKVGQANKAFGNIALTNSAQAIHPLAPYILTAHAISVKVGGVMSGGETKGASLEGVLILKGPHAGTLVLLSNEYNGSGTIHASIEGIGSIYHYLGNLNNLSPQTFSGESYQGSLGGRALESVGIGMSIAYDNYNGILVSTSYSYGKGGSVTGLSIDIGMEISKIVTIKDFNKK